MRSPIAWWLVMMLCMAAFGCTRDDKSELRVVPSQDIVSGVGHVAHVDLEGGFYAIVSDDGATYDPWSLPDGFKIDGLRVRFTVRIMTGWATTRQHGTLVEVLDIREVT